MPSGAAAGADDKLTIVRSKEVEGEVTRAIDSLELRARNIHAAATTTIATARISGLLRRNEVKKVLCRLVLMDLRTQSSRESLLERAALPALCEETRRIPSIEVSGWVTLAD